MVVADLMNLLTLSVISLYVFTIPFTGQLQKF